ncbi:hypothetical protein OG417_31620 [Actinoallomurus sp. NBC_01490]|uniref:hypothetical protein n=1 Tax=Actinoallomurus sp. NBC_01490 TaxID=2903557 RepID=UPI002E36C380|nr:hypothetical protein [Actinoallomurus sp. NBC_01490]
MTGAGGSAMSRHGHPGEVKDDLVLSWSPGGGRASIRRVVPSPATGMPVNLLLSGLST